MSVATHPPRATRLRRLAVVGGIALAAVVAAIVVSSGGSSPAPAPAPAADAAAPTNAMFSGLTERDGVLGDPGAPVTVTEFVDLQCPVCAEAARTTLPALVEDVRAGGIKLEARTLHFIGPDSVTAARAAAGAQAQGKLWPFLAAFYANQGQENSGYATDEFLRGVLSAAGADADKALADAQSDAAADELNTANAEAQTRGIDSTPSFVVTGPGGKTRVVAGHDDAAVAAAIKAVR